MIKNTTKEFLRNSTILLVILSIVITSCQKKATEKSIIKTDSIADNATPNEIKDSVMYTKTLSLQNISFTIKAFKDYVVITPKGYLVDNKPVSKPIDGTITNAEIEDLNSDGYPEVMIFCTSAGSGSYGSVLGFSSNKNKSMSEIAFPSFIDNPKINKGYMGHDEFAIVETNVVQRFPIYNEGDTNSNPTGKMRQIQYKLKEGEASRKLVVDKIIEY